MKLGQIVVITALVSVRLQAQAGDSAAGPADVFHKSTGPAATSVPGADIFRRSAAAHDGRGREPLQSDVVATDGRQPSGSGAHTAVDFMRYFGSRTSGSPAAPASVADTPVIDTSVAEAPVTVAPVAVAPVVEAPAAPAVPVVPVVVRRSMPPTPHAPAQEVRFAVATTPAVEPQASALTRETDQVHREVTPRYVAVRSALDRVRIEYNARLDSLARTESAIRDSSERVFWHKMVATARMRGDSTPQAAPVTAPAH